MRVSGRSGPSILAVKIEQVCLQISQFSDNVAAVTPGHGQRCQVVTGAARGVTDLAAVARPPGRGQPGWGPGWTRAGDQSAADRRGPPAPGARRRAGAEAGLPGPGPDLGWVTNRRQVTTRVLPV